MIHIIHQICQNAGCQAKDLVIEWNPARGARIIGTNSRGERTYLNIQARLDHIAQAIWLCASGQEDLYPQMRRQQEAVDAKVKEWLADNNDQFKQDFADQREEHPVKTAKRTVQDDWRRFKTATDIVRAFPQHPSTDDIIDLYQRNKKLNSAALKALMEKHSRKAH